MMQQLRWLTNLRDPRLPLRERYVIRATYQTEQEAAARLDEYLADKIIGPPKATAAYAVEQLQNQKTVGIYITDEVK